MNCDAQHCHNKAVYGIKRDGGGGTENFCHDCAHEIAVLFDKMRWKFTTTVLDERVTIGSLQVGEKFSFYSAEERKKPYNEGIWTVTEMFVEDLKLKWEEPDKNGEMPYFFNVGRVSFFRTPFTPLRVVVKDNGVIGTPDVSYLVYVIKEEK